MKEGEENEIMTMKKRKEKTGDSMEEENVSCLCSLLSCLYSLKDRKQINIAWTMAWHMSVCMRHNEGRRSMKTGRRTVSVVLKRKGEKEEKAG